MNGFYGLPVLYNPYVPRGHMLVATDGSSPAGRVLVVGPRLRLRSGAELVAEVLHLYANGDPDSAITQHAKAELEWRRSQGIKVDYEVDYPDLNSMFA